MTYRHAVEDRRRRSRYERGRLYRGVERTVWRIRDRDRLFCACAGCRALRRAALLHRAYRAKVGR